ncbi:MAG: class I SAM-dependent DNA methyltransferase [Atopobiaceae bacterium]|nr:class I SAM-dependent DNA methyltransferase [Atopobiaceae bacterium]
MAQVKYWQVKEFVKRWRDIRAANGGVIGEKGNTAKFWQDLQAALGYDHLHTTTYEDTPDGGGFSDVWLRDCSTMVEQKSSYIDLDKPEPRQGKMKTPLEQVLDYTYGLTQIDQPRYLITCNFVTFRVYDRSKFSDVALKDNAVEFTLDDLYYHPELLSFITNPENPRLEMEKEISIEAGKLVAELYKRLSAKYIDPESAESMHALNVLCVRIVFCLFCEDADLFEHDAFYEYLKDEPPSRIRNALADLFRALDTPKAERDPYDEEIKAFPYVNGGLFRERVVIPNFDEDLKSFLLKDMSQGVNWSNISPTIFGGIFESTLNPETRRSGGMHYTSPENIHKVIDPLFLNDLKARYAAIHNDEDMTPRKRKFALMKLHEHICSLRFFDPACGSGNFLTETYLELRKLEDGILRELHAGQVSFALVDDEEQGKRVSLNQFYGIEINDFAVTVAETSLWIARLKANGDKGSMFYDSGKEDFPLTEAANIVHGNALRMDWNDVLPADECNYIMGNPPFYGARWQSKEQKLEIIDAFHGAKNCGNVDYVAGWYIKASEYIEDYCIKCAFVSTNSICQGEQVASVWKPIFELGVRIDFAYDTFRWVNEATEQAHVFVVIVGFSKIGGRKVLFHHANPDADCIMQEAQNINAYLADGPDVFIYGRSKPICNVPLIGIGSQPIDDGNFLFSTAQKEEFLAKEPLAEKYFHPFIGSREFINGYTRWCLWLGEADDKSLADLPLCRERIENVRKFRLASKRKQTYDAASRPEHFGTEIIPHTSSVVIPQVSSQRRQYIPIGFIGPEVFCSDKLRVIADADLYQYGVLQSRFHNAWMRRTTGRLKDDYQYTNSIVYNCFVWPENLTDAQKDVVARKAQDVLDARAAHPDMSLAKLYDPKLMPQDLREAHAQLDSAVEWVYRVKFNGDEEKIVAHLFKLYAEKIGK